MQSEKAFLLAPQKPDTLLMLRTGQSGQIGRRNLGGGWMGGVYWTIFQFYLKVSPTPPPCCKGMDPWREDRVGWPRGGKAGAHRFAIFSHNFSLLLQHKKRRIPDYLWHSKPGRVEDSLNTGRTLLPTWLYNRNSHYQI